MMQNWLPILYLIIAGLSCSECWGYRNSALIIEDARCFKLTNFAGFKVLEVMNPDLGSNPEIRYLLVPREQKIPEGSNAYQIIRTPVTKFISLSTTHIFPLDVLGVLNLLIGVARSEDISNPEILERIKTGLIKEVGLFQKSSLESIVELNPDLVFVYGSNAPGEDLDSLKRMNIPLVFVSEFLESTPLGYAEWIKFFGVIFQQEQIASKHYSQLKANYETLSTTAKGLNKKPSVFVNIPYGGTWFMPGGGSYLARILADAGAIYPWHDNESSGSLRLSFETVIDKAGGADYWINPGNFLSLNSLRKSDPRFQIFNAFKKGAVYNMNRKILDNRPDDYFATALANPDKLLKDLIFIFHPTLLPEHRSEWYHQLP